jgi:hypothetical protein
MVAGCLRESTRTAMQSEPPCAGISKLATRPYLLVKLKKTDKEFVGTNGTDFN